jgi:hypothetical protein
LLTAAILALDAVGPSTPTILDKSCGDPDYVMAPGSVGIAPYQSTAEARKGDVDTWLTIRFPVERKR